MLKQIAEKDELERKEKMGNFVIPFFMQSGVCCNFCPHCNCLVAGVSFENDNVILV
jgi:hypothetical protein